MQTALLPCYFFDRVSAPARERELARGRRTTAEPKRRLVCAQCQHPVTAAEQRLSVNGAVEHRFTNPLGLEFHIACFREAPGCAAAGTATAEHTWFTGYAWQVGFCRQCGIHLGWLFSTGSDAFYGLIVGRLQERAP